MNLIEVRMTKQDWTEICMASCTGALPAAALLVGCGNALVIGKGIAGAGASGAGFKASVGALSISAGILAAS